MDFLHDIMDFPIPNELLNLIIDFASSKSVTNVRNQLKNISKYIYLYTMIPVQNIVLEWEELFENRKRMEIMDFSHKIYSCKCKAKPKTFVLIGSWRTAYNCFNRSEKSHSMSFSCPKCAIFNTVDIDCHNILLFIELSIFSLDKKIATAKII